MIRLTTLLVLLVAAQEDPIQPWVARLGNPDIEVREQAAAELLRAGERVRPVLERAARHPDPEVALRADDVLARLSALQILLPTDGTGSVPESRVDELLGRLSHPGPGSSAYFHRGLTLEFILLEEWALREGEERFRKD